MISITKIFKFSAAHWLSNHNGLCKNLHGHNYKLEITVKGDVKNKPDTSDVGMVMDFGVMKEIVRINVVRRLDHQSLNRFFPNPTCELMVEWVVNTLRSCFLSRGVRLEKVRLWETDTCYAEWKEC